MDPKIRSAALVIMELRDRQRQLATERRVGSPAGVWASGIADGLDLALASLAGIEGYGFRETLEATVNRDRGRDRRDNGMVDEGQTIEPTAAGSVITEARAMVAFVLGTARHPDDHPIVKARRDLLAWFDAAITEPHFHEADGSHARKPVESVEPMGGWEPRS